MSLAKPHLDMVMELVEALGGCGDHFPDELDCCRVCAACIHLIKHGYLDIGPEERKRFHKAMHAKKRKPSGWDAQVEADEAERAGTMIRGDGVRETTYEAAKRPRDFAERVEQARTSPVSLMGLK